MRANAGTSLWLPQSTLSIIIALINWGNTYNCDTSNSTRKQLKLFQQRVGCCEFDICTVNFEPTYHSKAASIQAELLALVSYLYLEQTQTVHQGRVLGPVLVPGRHMHTAPSLSSWPMRKKLATVTAHRELTVTKMVTASRDWAVIELWPIRDWAVITVIELSPHRDWAVT